MKKRKDILYLIIGLVILLIILIACMFVTPKGKEIKDRVLDVIVNNDLSEIDINSNSYIWQKTSYKECVSEKTECTLSMSDDNLKFILRIEEVEKEKVVVLYINNIKFNFSEPEYGNVYDYTINKVNKVNEYYYIVEMNNLEKGTTVLTVIDKAGKIVTEINKYTKFKKITEYEINANELTVISIVEHKANEILTLCKDYNDDDIIISVESIKFNEYDYTEPSEVADTTLKEVLKINYNLDSCAAAKKKYPDYKEN